MYNHYDIQFEYLPCISPTQKPCPGIDTRAIIPVLVRSVVLISILMAKVNVTKSRSA